MADSFEPLEETFHFRFILSSQHAVFRRSQDGFAVGSWSLGGRRW